MQFCTLDLSLIALLFFIGLVFVLRFTGRLPNAPKSSQKPPKATVLIYSLIRSLFFPPHPALCPPYTVIINEGWKFCIFIFDFCAALYGGNMPYVTPLFSPLSAPPHPPSLTLDAIKVWLQHYYPQLRRAPLGAAAHVPPPPFFHFFINLFFSRNWCLSGRASQQAG